MSLGSYATQPVYDLACCHPAAFAHLIKSHFLSYAS